MSREEKINLLQKLQSGKTTIEELNSPPNDFSNALIKLCCDEHEEESDSNTTYWIGDRKILKEEFDELHKKLPADASNIVFK